MKYTAIIIKITTKTTGSEQGSQLLYNFGPEAGRESLASIGGTKNCDINTLAPFTLRSIFGTARIKLVPVPLFWFLDYLFS
jgi:hypothetical protein